MLLLWVVGCLSAFVVSLEGVLLGLLLLMLASSGDEGSLLIFHTVFLHVSCILSFRSRSSRIVSPVAVWFFRFPCIFV